MEKETRRGFDPADAEGFSPEALSRLRTAADEYAWLLNRGYGAEGACAFVGNRHLLTRRQRLCLSKAVCPREQAAARKAREFLQCPLPPDAVLSVDGFNVIITAEVALSGSPVILCMDGAFRDLAGLRGSYRIIDKTAAAVSLLLDELEALRPKRTDVYLDAPVSNSGRLRELIAGMAGERGAPVTAQAIGGVDGELKKLPLVATSDAAVMDRCGGWLNLAARIIRRVQGRWEILL